MSCLHYIKKTKKCDMKICTYHKRDKDGYCLSKGENPAGHKKYHNYLCSKDKRI